MTGGFPMRNLFPSLNALRSFTVTGLAAAFARASNGASPGLTSTGPIIPAARQQVPDSQPDFFGLMWAGPIGFGLIRIFVLEMFRFAARLRASRASKACE